ncbi:MAG: hypothetical protein K2N01_12875 [Lachnospiraceae bacterium]|nr:hypothetical protein [Lachnospiraceae bacterium]
MWEVNIYLRTTYHGPRPAEGWYCEVLETTVGEKKKTREHFGHAYGTANRIALENLLDALGHMKEPAALSIYADSRYLVQGIGQLREWKTSGWVTKKGAEVKNKDLWTRISTELERHLVSAEYTERTEYYNWQYGEMKRRMREEKEHEQKVKIMQLQHQD